MVKGIMENLKETFSRKKLERTLEKELEKTSHLRITQIMIIFLGISLALGFLQSNIERNQSSFTDIFSSYIGLALVGLFFAVSFWIAAVSIGERKFSFIKAIHSQLLFIIFALVGGFVVNILVLILLLIPSIGNVLALIIGIVQLAGGLFLVFALLKGVVGTYGKAAKVWGVGQLVQIALAIGLFILYTGLRPDPWTTPSYYTAETIQNANGTLLILNYTREGIRSEYCAVQLGKEWTMLKPDPVRDNFYTNNKSKIYSNDTRRFINQFNDTITFWGIAAQGGSYKECLDSGSVIGKDYAICYHLDYDQNYKKYYSKGYYKNEQDVSHRFEVNTTLNNTRFLSIMNTTMCDSVWLSDALINRIYFG